MKKLLLMTACAVALASLDLFEKNNLLAHAHRLGQIMDDLLAPIRNRPYIHDVRRRGLIAAIDLAQPNGQPFPPHWRIGGALCTQLRSLQVMLRPLADTIVLMPPLAISEENLRLLCAAVVKSADWLPDIVAQKRREFGAST